MPTAILSTLTGSVVLAGALLVLRARPDGPAGSGWWAAAFLVAALRHGANFAAASAAVPLPVAVFAAESLQAVTALLLLAGTMAFIGRRPPVVVLLAAVAAIAAWTAVTTFVQDAFLWRTVPLYGFSGVVMLVTARALWPRPGDEGPGARRAVAVVFALWGVHKLDYPVLRPMADVAPWGFLVAHVLAMVLAVGLLVLVQQRVVARAEREAVERRRTEADLRGIIDNMDEVFYRVDHAGVVRSVSPAVGDLLGLAPEAVVGRPVTDFYADPTDREHLLAALRRAGGRIAGYELALCRADGSQRWVSVNAHDWRDPDGRRLGVEGLVRDVTGRRAVELELARRSATLRRRNRDLEQFAHAAGHDLQEPLRMISTYLQFLERHLGDGLDAAGREYLGFAVDGAKRLHRLIDGLLAFTRVDSRGDTFEPVALGDVVAAAEANLRRALADSGGSIERAGALPRVQGDSAQLLSVFQNLFSNAIRYRHPERPPHIRVRAVPDGTLWRIHVADNGPGIPTAQAESIFRIFQRLDRRDDGGLGLGLALSKRIVERHGGTIWLEATSEAGSTFCFTLPGAEA